MKTKNDEELQRMLDELGGSLPEEAGHDAITYHKLYEALNSPPTILLSDKFAENVTALVIRQRIREERRHHIMLALAVVVSLVLSTLTVYFTDATLFKVLAQHLWQAKAIIAFAVIMLTFVQLGDRWLVRPTR